MSVFEDWEEKFPGCPKNKKDVGVVRILVSKCFNSTVLLRGWHHANWANSSISQIVELCTTYNSMSLAGNILLNKAGNEAALCLTLSTSESSPPVHTGEKMQIYLEIKSF